MLTGLYKHAMTDNSALLCVGRLSCSWFLRTPGKRSLQNFKQTGIPTPPTRPPPTQICCTYNYRLLVQDCAALDKKLAWDLSKHACWKNVAFRNQLPCVSEVALVTSPAAAVFSSYIRHTKPAHINTWLLRCTACLSGRVTDQNK